MELGNEYIDHMGVLANRYLFTRRYSSLKTVTMTKFSIGNYCVCSFLYEKGSFIVNLPLTLILPFLYSTKPFYILDLRNSSELDRTLVFGRSRIIISRKFHVQIVARGIP